jgi:hypothetical protein
VTIIVHFAAKILPCNSCANFGNWITWRWRVWNEYGLVTSHIRLNSFVGVGERYLTKFWKLCCENQNMALGPSFHIAVPCMLWINAPDYWHSLAWEFWTRNCVQCWAASFVHNATSLECGQHILSCKRTPHSGHYMYSYNMCQNTQLWTVHAPSFYSVKHCRLSYWIWKQMVLLFKMHEYILS